MLKACLAVIGVLATYAWALSSDHRLAQEYAAGVRAGGAVSRVRGDEVDGHTAMFVELQGLLRSRCDKCVTCLSLPETATSIMKLYLTKEEK